MSVADAAAQLQVTQRFVRRLIAVGKLDAVKIGTLSCGYGAVTSRRPFDRSARVRGHSPQVPAAWNITNKAPADRRD